MSHLSENSRRLKKQITVITSLDQLVASQHSGPGVYLFHFPGGRTDLDASLSAEAYKKMSRYCRQLDAKSTVCILTTPPEAARLLPFLEKALEFKLWIAVKLSPNVYPEQSGKLPEQHTALLVLTRSTGSLRHTKTRIKYTYCPSCGKTTKDYGGKKHTYHAEGTLLSDVWRDIECDPFRDIAPIIDRLQDLFGIEPYKMLEVLDLRSCPELVHRQQTEFPAYAQAPKNTQNLTVITSQLLNEDCLTALRAMPDSSVDFCFADPPYNLQKTYSHWDDDMASIEYFSWCDQWLSELARVLKPGRTLAVVNIPLWAVRHYQYLCRHPDLQFQQWIAWDALSFPVRLIMPAHYAILCFSKGAPRPLPGFDTSMLQKQESEYLQPLKDSYCLRDTCIARRARMGIKDRTELYDIWYDIHRLKHNSRRVDHPCQLPPLLMRRLYALFTRPGEIILDCFNGAGTSTLAAQQMQRRYIGIELSPEYHQLACQRHEQLSNGKDPFAKNDDVPKSKNSRVERLPKQTYAVPKKTLQLDVKRIAQQLGRLPTREEVKNLSRYPIDYYDNYFVSWGEVCAAARNSGMSELPPESQRPTKQLSFAFDAPSF